MRPGVCLRVNGVDTHEHTHARTSGLLEASEGNMKAPVDRADEGSEGSERGDAVSVSLVLDLLVVGERLDSSLPSVSWAARVDDGGFQTVVCPADLDLLLVLVLQMHQ